MLVPVGGVDPEELRAAFERAQVGVGRVVVAALDAGREGAEHELSPFELEVEHQAREVSAVGGDALEGGLDALVRGLRRDAELFADLRVGLALDAKLKGGLDAQRLGGRLRAGAAPVLLVAHAASACGTGQSQRSKLSRSMR